MPWHKVHNHSECPASRPWAVVKDADGEVEGCHDSEAAADRQLAALYASEPDQELDEIATGVAQMVTAQAGWEHFPIRHDPHSGKFMPGEHVDEGGGEGGGASGDGNVGAGGTAYGGTGGVRASETGNYSSAKARQTSYNKQQKDIQGHLKDPSSPRPPSAVSASDSTMTRQLSGKEPMTEHTARRVQSADAAFNRYSVASTKTTEYHAIHRPMDEGRLTSGANLTHAKVGDVVTADGYMEVNSSEATISKRTASNNRSGFSANHMRITTPPGTPVLDARENGNGSAYLPRGSRFQVKAIRDNGDMDLEVIP